jgi:uncharacterized RDD family membrane protein YckC
MAGSLWLAGVASPAQTVQTTNAEVADVTNVQEVVSTVAANTVVTNNADFGVTRERGFQRDAVVAFGQDAELKEGDNAESVVAIGGSANVRGKVRDAVVAIGGNVNLDGEVHDAAVAVLGSVTLGPHAIVHGDVVSVGGRITTSEGAVVKGRLQEVPFNIPGLPKMEALTLWMGQCVFKLRPLAPQVGWVWVVAGISFLLCLLVAVVFPRPVQVCVGELSERPATTFFAGLLTKLFLPVILLILAATGIGLVVIPLILAALFFGVLVGKVALLEHVGGALGRIFGLEMLKLPVAAFVLGSVLITLLYMVPVLGFVIYAIIGFWGLGVAMTGMLGRVGRERRQRPPGPGAASALDATAGAAVATAGALGEGIPPGATTAMSAGEPPVYPGVPAMLAYPRAGFWERMAAAFLDLALLCIPAFVVGPFCLLVALAYFAGMWTWKGTTIGGIVLNLKVVRHDGGPLNFLVAFVRALAAAFSAMVFFLGFFWIGWGGEKQGWHDKIAGTVVVRLPRSMPLVCL